MQDPTALSKDQLLELFKQQQALLEASQTQLTTQESQLRIKDDTIKQIQQQSDNWQQLYLKLWQERFAAKSERYIHDPDQLRLDFGNTPDANDAADGLAEALEELAGKKKHKPRKKRDESLPAHLPRYEVTAEVPESEKICDLHGEKTLLPETMWDATEKLELIPAVLQVRVTKYPKYACEGSPECGITTPQRPTGIVEGDKYDTSIAAEIITGKYGYHLPIYRQQDWFASSGWTSSRSTLLNILTRSHFILEPLFDYFKQTVLTDSAIGSDDTGVTLLYPKELPQFNLDDPKERRIHEVFTKALEEDKSSINAKMWAYRGVNVKLNLFEFTVSRHRDGPEWFFENYRGTILGDCWHGFHSIALKSAGAIKRAACTAHARRKIEESTAYPADRHTWLTWFQELYDIYDREKGLSPEAILELRQSEAKPIWDAMRAWLSEVQLRTEMVVLPKSDFGKALQYIRNHVAELRLYLNDPQLPIDNNETEQLMKQVAIGRKNWMFTGSVAGGERIAGFLTLVSSALRNDLDVWQYVNDVLKRLLAGETEYEPLLPWLWAAKHPEAIRQYRVEERKDRAQRKKIKREARRKNKKRN